MQHGFSLSEELHGQRGPGGVHPVGPHGVAVDDGDGAEHSRAYQSRTPDAGAKQGPTKWFAHRVGKYQTVLSQRVGLAVLLDDLN
jgi:hypothetical protein